MNSNKIALCIYGTMRGPNNCLPTLYQNIIKPWDTDVFVCINKQYNDDDVRLSMLQSFGAKIIEKNIEQQPDVYTWFPKSFYERLVPLAKNKLKESNANNVNFLSPIVGSHSSLHIRLNWYRFSFIIEKYLEEYDFFIFTRPDHLYLFPIFDKSFLQKENIIHYDEHGWGGLNADFIIIHRDLVIDWLRKSIDYLTKETLQDILIKELKEIDLWNSERYSLLVADLNSWKMKKMAINSFISADSLDELTSNNPIMHDGQYYYKYDTNYRPCLKNFELWKSGFKWKNSEEKISLKNN